jgi:hypothetical protein
VPLSRLGTHTDPKPIAIPGGLSPTGIVRVARPVAASILQATSSTVSKASVLAREEIVAAPPGWLSATA